MPLRANATLIFQRYHVDDDGIRLTFLCPDPGPGQESEYVVLLLDTDLAAVSTQIQLRNLVITAVQRRLRAAGIASKLDPFIGQSVVA
jgi:hypothetical protein